ncbi:MAG TPA: OmpA family protein [Polyangiaceae bacterium LLY-WYZ-14_1]|jgi:outer membrane protein OmpA-like peptidoglycan-associated protein|nr:OmpA family protein [Polyangiaceae bacterium LLY-WYZ-14_1]
MMRTTDPRCAVLGLALLGACATETETQTSDDGSTTTTTAAVRTAQPASSGSEAPAQPDPDDVRIVGDHLEVDGTINFATDSDEILADSNELLDHIALLVKNHRDEIAHLKIVGHTDNDGGHDYNQDLSERRAAAVAQALVDRGVDIELEHSGVGETEPVCTEDTDECHARNRRVEFLIVQDEPATEPA